MKLAERQEQLITGYLREVAHLAGEGVTEKDRERGLGRLEDRIRAGIARLRKVQPEDAEVEGVLKALGSSAVQAALLDAPEPGDIRAGKEARRVWLGVCHWVAEKTEFPAQIVRAAAILLGCCTGPIALLIYMTAYAIMRNGQPKEERDPIDWMLIVWRVATSFLTVYFLSVGFEYLVRGLEAAYGQGVARGLPSMGDWGELRYRAGEYYTYAFMSCLPLAGFSALPLQRAWSKSIYRFSQALIALYAIALCYGTAKFLVGIILDFVKQFSGNIELPFHGMF